MKISVNAGHSTKVKGAVGYLDEAVEVHKIAPLLNKELRRRGANSFLAPNVGNSRNAYLREEVNHANNIGADLAISLHMNAGGGRGVEVYHYPGSRKGREYASKVSAGLSKALGLPNRGAKAANFFFLRNTKMTAILVEVCFVDSRIDEQQYKKLKPAGVAQAIAAAVLGGSSAAPVSKPTATPKKNKKIQTGSIVDYLKSIGVNSSMSNRKRLAAQYGIANYRGTASQNIQLLNAMRGGGAPAASTPSNIEQVVDRVLQGEFGNGETRKRKLKNAGYNYSVVQAEVNRRLGVKTTPSKKKSVSVGSKVTTNKLYTTSSSTKNVRKTPITGYVDKINNNWRNPIRLKRNGKYIGFTRYSDLKL